MTTTLLVAGVQFLILGVLGEYVGRAFLSANGKPQGMVREIGSGHARRDAPRDDLLAGARRGDLHQLVGQVLLKAGAGGGHFVAQLFGRPR